MTAFPVFLFIIILICLMGWSEPEPERRSRTQRKKNKAIDQDHYNLSHLFHFGFQQWVALLCGFILAFGNLKGFFL